MKSKELEFLREHFKDKSLQDILDLAFEIYPDMNLDKDAYEELKSVLDKGEGKSS